MNSQKIAQLKAENEQLVKSLNHLMAQNLSAENLLNELLERANPSAIECGSLVSKIHMLHMHWHRKCHDLQHGQGPSMVGVPTKVIMMKGRKQGLSHEVAFYMAIEKAKQVASEALTAIASKAKQQGQGQ